MPPVSEAVAELSSAEGPVMQCNVGGAERGLRLVIGVVAIAVAVFGGVEGGWRIALLAIGAIGLLTAAVRYCPLNSLIGRNSCRSA